MFTNIRSIFLRALAFFCPVVIALNATAQPNPAADGYTLLLADIGTLAIAPSVYPALPFDPVKDFAPVSMVAYSPHILVVHPSVKASNVKELIEYAKANQGKMNYATSGVGGANHLAGVEFANRTGVQWVYVPYKGGAQAIADVAGGQSNVMKNG